MRFISSERFRRLRACQPWVTLVACTLGMSLPAWSQDGPLRAPSVDLGDRLGATSIYGEQERLPVVDSGQMTLPPIMAATTAISEIGNGSAPREFRSEAETLTSDLPEAGFERDAQWVPTNYHFAAANTFSHPRYFEDRMLERHGHERFPHLQPMVSGARFFATFPMLPYLMTVRPPCECEYQMGYFRPGSCVYPYHQRPPYQRDAVIVEAAAIAGASVAIP
ncbi:MAG: hypothetical protein ACO1RT_05715 [Planctomycetaceae bacterium]